MDMVEQKMNEWANEIAPRYRIKKNSFKIVIKQNKETLQPTSYGYMVQDGSYHEWMENDSSSVSRAKRTYIVKPNDLLSSHSQLLATVSNGSVVIITLYVPLVKKGEDDLSQHLKSTIKKMKITCKGLMKYISNPKLHHDSELFNPTLIGETLHEYILGADATKVWKRRRIDIDEKNGLHKGKFIFELERKVTVTHRETGISHTVIDYEGIKTEWELRDEAWDMCSMLVNNHLYGEEIKYRSLCVDIVPFGHYHTLVHPIWD